MATARVVRVVPTQVVTGDGEIIHGRRLYWVALARLAVVAGVCAVLTGFLGGGAVAGDNLARLLLVVAVVVDVRLVRRVL